MVDELSRIASHLLFFGTYCMDLGATTALLYGMRERETILDILEATTGARMSFNYNTIGGVRADLYPTFQEKVKEFLAIMPERLKEYHQLVTGNIIFQNRLKGVGVLSKEDAVDYGVAGPSGRASGWACDLRKTNPYSIYSELDFEQVVLDGCDSFDRYLVRLKEIEQSCKILEQLVDNIMNDALQHDDVVILMHDLESRHTTVESLPMLIERLRDDGYELLPIDENAPLIRHR